MHGICFNIKKLLTQNTIPLCSKFHLPCDVGDLFAPDINIDVELPFLDVTDSLVDMFSDVDVSIDFLEILPLLASRFVWMSEI